MGRRNRHMRKQTASTAHKSTNFNAQNTIASPSLPQATTTRSWAQIVRNSPLPAVTPPTTPRTFPKFLHLATELQRQIWAIVILDWTAANALTPQAYRHLPPMVFVSHRTMPDIFAAWLELGVFRIDSYAQNQRLYSFLAGHPDRFASVRELRFPAFGYFSPACPRNADVDLAARCTGLKTLRLTLDDSKLTVRLQDAGGRVRVEPRCAADVFAEYDLGGVFACAVLKEIVLEHDPRISSAAFAALSELVTVLQQRCKEALGHRAVDIRREEIIPEGFYPRAFRPW